MEERAIAQIKRWRLHSKTPWQADDLVEFPLLLTGFQATALEDAARRRDLTPAQLLRQLIRQISKSEVRSQKSNQS
jgi:hypothetical protein